MLTLSNPPKSMGKLPPTDPAYPTVKDRFERLIAGYTWEGCPYSTLLTIPWEGIMHRDGT